VVDTCRHRGERECIGNSFTCFTPSLLHRGEWAGNAREMVPMPPYPSVGGDRGAVIALVVAAALCVFVVELGLLSPAYAHRPAGDPR
jgi:hypothetical protein